MKQLTTTQLRELFAQRIIDARKARGWSQAQLARQMGTSSGFVCDYEKARQSPSIDTVLRFANALGVSPASLLDVAKQPEKNSEKSA